MPRRDKLEDRYREWDFTKHGVTTSKISLPNGILMSKHRSNTLANLSSGQIQSSPVEFNQLLDCFTECKEMITEYGKKIEELHELSDKIDKFIGSHHGSFSRTRLNDPATKLPQAMEYLARAGVINYRLKNARHVKFVETEQVLGNAKEHLFNSTWFVTRVTPKRVYISRGENMYEIFFNWDGELQPCAATYSEQSAVLDIGGTFPEGIDKFYKANKGIKV